MRIWQLRRLLGLRSAAVAPSISSCSSPMGSSLSRNAGSTYTWQVAHNIAPPHSATMPSMPFLTAFSMTVVPTGTSIVVVSPVCEI